MYLVSGLDSMLKYYKLGKNLVFGSFARVTDVRISSPSRIFLLMLCCRLMATDCPQQGTAHGSPSNAFLQPLQCSICPGLAMSYNHAPEGSYSCLIFKDSCCCSDVGLWHVNASRTNLSICIETTNLSFKPP